jgi:hypothetical protein
MDIYEGKYIIKYDFITWRDKVTTQDLHTLVLYAVALIFNTFILKLNAFSDCIKIKHFRIGCKPLLRTVLISSVI